MTREKQERCKHGHALPLDRWRERVIKGKTYRVRDCGDCKLIRAMYAPGERPGGAEHANESEDV
jgi:hypothetical protein